MTAVKSASPVISAPPVRFYPEREDREDGWLDSAGKEIFGWLGRQAASSLRPTSESFKVWKVRGAQRRMAQLSENAVAERLCDLRAQIRRGGLTSVNVRAGLALAADASSRELDLTVRPGQLRGAMSMIAGRLIEMDTGEGKTVTAALAAATAAMAGFPVHVITVNNYLAERDCSYLTPFFNRLGLKVSAIVEDATPEERREAYGADVTYCSNTEIAFDYLRDRIAFGPEGPRGLRQRLRRVVGAADGQGQHVLRGLQFAIIDEADSVLVDEARTPLIISQRSDPDEEAAWTGRALDIARSLDKGRDYQIIGEDRRVRLTDKGKEALENICEGDEGIWTSVIRREEVIHQALSALFIFKRGEHYLVYDEKVQIVDEYTGRLQPDRSWSDGLHQLIEAKEGVEITGQNLAIARMTYQRFFRRYVRISGMTGTAREVRDELMSVYNLPVERIAPHKPSRLAYAQPQVFARARSKWAAVITDTRRAVRDGRPVLIGTRSVAASQTVSAALTIAGLAHDVLNAENDSKEAEIIAGAGTAGRITVATNMAGRGVDIYLGPGVAESGGLHIILTERHDAGRIDRQFAGRAGRRGEPGSVATFLSLQDPLLEVLQSPLRKWLARLPWASASIRIKLFDEAQKRAERSHARMRKDLVRQDQRLNQLLSFTGGLE